ncbi:hypothetical protein DFP74_4036 [Nocardiopsis sp. Huas11]|uniref:hypothetical protein n=1 Tax=Nocardiopsis sp. Huas11 TaxID=2183912 RepID=UPI000EB4DE6F|nr:hypothetical protein [Nocardiopsis sp. Huas11]RKS08339.1 hypothetical protein DFP74_4036 [Nocardiopsis sp. Huas11]
MPVTHPLTFPRPLLMPDAHEDGAYSAFSHLAVDFSPSGDCYVLSVLRQYSACRTRGIRVLTVSRHRPDGSLAAHVVLRHTKDEEPETRSGIPTDVRDLCVLPDGTLALSTPENRTFLVDADLTRLLGAWEGAPRTGRYGERLDVAEHVESSFAAAIRTTPSGRLLCAVAEFGVHNHTGSVPNLIGLTDGPLKPGHRPTVEVLACLHTPEETRGLPSLRGDTSPTIPYTDHRGAPAGRNNRPSPGIVAAARARWPELGAQIRAKQFRPHLEAFAVVADDLFVVPVFDDWRPIKSSEYAYALVDDSGALVGRLDGPGTEERSPEPGDHHAVVADPARGRIFHVNRSGLYLWSADGTLLTMLPTTDKAYRGLKHLTLMGCGPEGDLVLIRQEHGLLTRVEVPEDLDRLGEAVAAALADHTRRRTRLKKQLAPTDWLWTREDVPALL